MIVVPPRPQWEAWLDAPAQRSMDFMNQYPAERLVATPAPRPTKPKTPAEKAKPTPAAVAREPDLFG